MRSFGVGLMCSSEDWPSEDVSNGYFALCKFYDEAPDFLNRSADEGYRLLCCVFFGFSKFA